MKRRIFALALIALMICSLFAGCGQASTYKTIEAAVKKTQELDAMSVTTEVVMTISADGMALTLPTTMTIKANDLKGNDPVVWTEFTINMLGQELSAQIYQEDGWSYTVIADDKAKTQSPPQLDQYDYSEEVVQVVPKELLKDVELEKGADGSATATINISGEDFMKVYSDMVDSASANLPSASGDMSVKDAQVVITVANGYVSSYDIAFCLEITDGEDVSSVDVEASVVYENPGQPVEITPPEGYLDFEER